MWLLLLHHEEHMDIGTMETQLQDFARHLQRGNCNQRFVPHSVSSIGVVGTTIPAPGMSNTGFGHSVIATTSGDISMMPVHSSKTLISNPSGMGHMLPAGSGFDHMRSNSFMAADGNSNKMVNVLANSGDNFSSVPGPLGNMLQSQQGFGGMSMGAENQIIATRGLQGVRSQMIPTSGLRKSASALIKTSPSGGMGHSSVNYIRTIPPQQISGGASGCFYHNMSGQMGGNNMRWKNSSYGLVNGSMNCGIQMAENNQNLMDGTAALSNSGGYLNTLQYGNVQLHASSDQNTAQQHRQGLLQSAMTNQMIPLSGDGYALNAADLAGSRNLHGPVPSGVLSVASSLNGKPIGLQSTKTLPVLGLLSQQQILPTLQQCRQNQSQKMSSPHGLSFLPKGQSIQSKQQKLRYQQQQSQDQQEAQSNNVYNDVAAQVKPKVCLQREHELQSQERRHLPQQFSCMIQQQKPSQEELTQLMHKDMVREHQPSQQVSRNAIASTAASQPRPGTAGSASGNMQPNVSSKQQKMQYCKQQMWLLLLHHASRCRDPEGQCQTSNCIIGRKLWAHVTTCHDTQCIYPHCHESRKLLIHRQQCQNNSCPVCRPVWEYIMKQHANGYAQSSNLGALDFVNVVPKSSNFHSTGGAKINLPASCGTSIHDTAQEEQHSLKRRKTEPASPSYAHQGDSIHDTAQEEQCSIKRRKIESASPSYAHQRAESAMVSVRSPSEVQELTQMQTQAFQPSGHDAGMMESHVLKSSKVEPIPVNIEQAVSSQKGLNQNIEPASPSYAHQGASIHDTTQEEHYSIKRRKTEPASLSHAHQGAESAMVSVRSSSEVQAVTQMQTQAFQPSGHDAGMMESHVLRSSKVEPIPVNIEQAVSSQQGLSQNTEPASPSYADKGASIHDTAQEEQRSFKRRKTEPASPSHAHQGAESAMVSVSSPSEVQAPTQMQTQAFQPSGHDAGMMESHVLKSSKVDPIPVNIEQAVSSQQGLSQKSWEFKNDICQNPHAEHGHIQGQPAKAEPGVSFSENVPMQVKQEAVQETIIDISPPDNSASEKFVKPAKINGVSLTELFTLEQIREHVIGLQQWGWQSKAKDENYQIMEFQMTGETCQLCNLDTIKFDPSPIYCSPCGVRIKRNAIYYLLAAADTRYCFCIACYSESQGDSVKIDGNAYAKLNLEKKKNMDETEEPWVCCDICKKWQHQVCVLFNDKRNKNEQAEYTCPNCYTEQLKRGVRQPLPHSVVLGAKDIPRTFLSDHIEKRLIRRLKEERQERAKALGKNFEEVPGTEALVVRVVSSVDKILEVKQGFLDIFEHQNYPSEFPYKSKVLLLFQKIEGVEVCLFGMYAQEFGSECSHPNQRRIYLSYLDSVRYFRPDVKTVTGEALRTFVYHEILIGYLDYCKSRGLTSCYIWACPAPKGEDYILYCHPETQKTPKSDKLREWYLTMLRKASKEDIVVDVTNMYDYFFVSTGERKAKVTAARLPYFEGDYWPGAAEEMILQIQREEADGQKYQKNKKYTTKRSLKATAQTEVARNTSKDALLMKKLGDSIHPMKEDFIMVHLQQACTHCCLFIVSGKRWVCKQCKDFQLCEKCYKAEQKLDERERHPVKKREKHMLFSIEVTNVPADTKDKDEIMESEFFDTRQAFLSLCQGNHYQYDTLRRAEHSSMMILYHLHNPTAPAFVSTCNICQQDIETGQGLRCEVCPDYDLCNVCYQRDDSVKHPHRFTAHPSLADRDAQNQEAWQHRVLQLRKMRDLLLHASRCLSPQCAYQNCRKVKALFRHAMNCKKRAAQGCSPCKKLWYILQLHARACNESECCVPRCRDLKQHIRRSQNQMESRRRADVMEMMRNRAAEIAQDSHSSHVH